MDSWLEEAYEDRNGYPEDDFDFLVDEDYQLNGRCEICDQVLIDCECNEYDDF